MASQIASIAEESPGARALLAAGTEMTRQQITEFMLDTLRAPLDRAR